MTNNLFDDFQAVAGKLKFGFVYDPGRAMVDVFGKGSELSVALANSDETAAEILKHSPTVELQFRSLDDLMKATDGDLERVKAVLKAAGSQVTVHGSFLRNDYEGEQMDIGRYCGIKFGGDDALKRDHQVANRSPIHAHWDVVPEGYGNPVLMPGTVTPQERAKMVAVAARFAELNPDGRILLSRHITSPGAYLDAQGFDEFLRIQDQVREAAGGQNVDYVLETGGATAGQIERLISEGYRIVVDTDHLTCDSDFEASGITDPVAYAVKILERDGVVAEVHASSMLSVKPDGSHVDNHNPLHYKGDDHDPKHLARIGTVLKTVGDQPVIFEVPGYETSLKKDMAEVNRMLD